MKILGYNRVFGRSKDVTNNLIDMLLACLDWSPVVLNVVSAYTSDHRRLVDLEVNPRDYTNSDDFKNDYLAVSFLSKYPFLDTKIDCQAVALEKFRLAEANCLETNHRLRSSYAGRINHDRRLSSILYRAQINIGKVLPDFSEDEMFRLAAFGPGSTFSLNRQRGDSYYKFGHLSPTVTLGCAALAERAISAVPGWKNHLISSEGFQGLQIVPGNRVTTVPKNAKGDRTIAIEPDLNMYLQKGIGAMVRRALRAVGVNLDSQSKNQELARVGSADGSLATLDLKAASDSVSMELVEMLLPTDWVDAILSTRSPVGVLPSGEFLDYQKVSSMGNGFTFELESLIFWALGKAVLDSRGDSDRRLAVYGDDIIVPTAACEDLIEVLSYCGFDLNMEKSFWSGPFRESCGKHWFTGVDVTPIYLRKKVDTVERLFWWCNTIRQYSRYGCGFGCNADFQPAFERGLSYLPRSLRRPSVPLTVNNVRFSDTAIAGDFDEAHPRFNRRLQSFEAVSLVRVFETLRGEGVPFLLRQLSKLESRDSECHIGASDAGISSQRWKYRQVKTCVPQWDWIGPWL